jgi:hypothetical protein
MVYCESCNIERLDGPESCPKCGRRLSHAAPRSPSADVEIDDASVAAPPPPEAPEHPPQAAPGVRVVGGRPRRGRRYLITYLGKERSVTDWARELGLSPALLYRRLQEGQGVPDLLAPEGERRSPGRKRELKSQVFLRLEGDIVCVVDGERYKDRKEVAFSRFLSDSLVGDVLHLGPDSYLVRLGDLHELVPNKTEARDVAADE